MKPQHGQAFMAKARPFEGRRSFFFVEWRETGFASMTSRRPDKRESTTGGSVAKVRGASGFG
jgi:hypothetical protein